MGKTSIDSYLKPFTYMLRSLVSISVEQEMDSRLITTIITLMWLFSALAANDEFPAICEQPAVEVNEEFIACCRGKPTFSSEPCIDALIENGTLTQECMVDCLYKEIGIYDGEVLNLTAVSHFFEENIRDLDMRQMYLNAFEYCNSLERDTLLQRLAFVEMPNVSDCDTYPAYVDQCVWYHTVSHCPKNYNNVNEQCTIKQNWVRTCLLDEE